MDALRVSVVLLVIACAVAGQESSAPEPATEPAETFARGVDGPAVTLTDEQLESLVAPVALYPEVLLSRVLEACRHPGSIVKATDVMRHPSGKHVPGDLAGPAKALLLVPPALLMLDEHLNWATRLGHADQSHPEKIVAALHAVRRHAIAAGNLRDNEIIRVEGSEAAPMIVTAEVNSLSVPVYDPGELTAPHEDGDTDWIAWSKPITFEKYRTVEAALRGAEYVPSRDPVRDLRGHQGRSDVEVETDVWYGRDRRLFRGGYANWGWRAWRPFGGLFHHR